MRVEILAVVVLGAVASAALVKLEQPGRRVCYFSSWAVYRPGAGRYDIEDIPTELCSHIIYAFAGIDQNTWELKPMDYQRDIDDGGYRRFTALKNSQLKALLSVGGWGEGSQGFSSMVAEASRRQLFIQSVRDYLDTFGFDGLDLDWEFPGSTDLGGTPQDKDNLQLLVNEMRTVFDNKGWQLTVAVSSNRTTVENAYKVSELCRNADAIHAMTYDMRGSWNQFADVHSQLHRRPELDQGHLAELNVNDALLMWEELGCPANKMVVGTPFYGRTYTLADASQTALGSPIRGDGAPGTFTNAPGILAYYEICLNLINPNVGWVEERDNIGLVPFAHKGDQWVGYEDAASLGTKAEFVRNKGYAGVMVFALDMDDFRNLCGYGVNPLMSALNAAMKDYVVSRH